jgi:hypothetical protein
MEMYMQRTHKYPCKSPAVILVKLLFLCLFLDIGSPYAAQAVSQLEILLPQPPESWDYRYPPPCPALLKLLK